MSSTRQLKFARMIQKELGELFQRDNRHLLNGAFVTVTRCEMSPDLSVAKVHLSFLLSSEKETLLQNIEDHKKSIRQQLGAKIRHQVRIVPELVFYLDEGAEYASHIEKVMNKLNIPDSEAGTSK
jgi:ribosome-binding factor A